MTDTIVIGMFIGLMFFGLGMLLKEASTRLEEPKDYADD